MPTNYTSLGNIAKGAYSHVKQHGITANNLRNIGRGVAKKLPGQLYTNLRASGSVGKPPSLKSLAMNDEMEQMTAFPSSKESILKGLTRIKAPAPRAPLLARAGPLSPRSPSPYRVSSSPQPITPYMNSTAEDPQPLLMGGRRTRKAKARARRYTRRR